MRTLISIFSAYYFLHFSIDSVKENKVSKPGIVGHLFTILKIANRNKLPQIKTLPFE